jgi:hypothetical protein
LTKCSWANLTHWLYIYPHYFPLRIIILKCAWVWAMKPSDSMAWIQIEILKSQIYTWFDCFVECEAGTYGVNCSEVCQDGYYGRRCKEECSKECNETCNKVNGQCPGILISIRMQKFYNSYFSLQFFIMTPKSLIGTAKKDKVLLGNFYCSYTGASYPFGSQSHILI